MDGKIRNVNSLKKNLGNKEADAADALSTSSGENNNNVCTEKVLGSSHLVVYDKGSPNLGESNVQIEQRISDFEWELSQESDEELDDDVESILDDDVLVDVNVSEDEEFLDKTDSVKIKPVEKPEQPEPIPPEVIEQLKNNPALNQYIGSLIEVGVDAKLKVFGSHREEPKHKGKNKKWGIHLHLCRIKGMGSQTQQKKEMNS